MPSNGQEGWKNYDYSPEINFGNSGGTAGVVAVSTALTAVTTPAIVAGGTSAFATGAFAASIPVVGWVVAAAAVIIGFGQMIHQGEKAKQYEVTAKSLELVGKELESELAVLTSEGQALINENNKRIKAMQKTILHQQKLRMISMSLMGVTGLVVAYEVYNQTK